MITILDTTLRDGGYLNEWNFGEKNISSIVERLYFAGVEYIELGFLSNQKIDKDKTIFNSLDLKISKEIQEKLCLMIKSSEFDVFNLEKPKEDGVNKLRYIFRKNQKKRALSDCKRIIELGYRLFVNPVFIDEYSENEYLNLVEEINEINPFAFSVVDSMGTFDSFKIKKVFLKLDKILNEKICFGLHCHNNLGNAKENILELINLKLNRDIIIDCTVFGMGRGAGNMQSEVFAKYLNDEFLAKYKIEFLNEIKEKYIDLYFQKNAWGSNSFYEICAKNKCHSNYASFLIKKQKELSNEFLNKIFSKIPADKKTIYDENIFMKILKDVNCNNSGNY